jgi:hypothetical protein
MNSSQLLEEFVDFSNRLRDSLAKRPEVVGLVLVGSTADLARVDEWSDHDFYVVTANGAAESLRQDLRWLPNFDDIVMRPRETDHGLKVVYANGQVLEFAVFDDVELEQAGANAYNVTLDRSNISERMLAIAQKSKPKPYDFDTEFEVFLGQMLIGIGRARRGELLIAGQFIRSYCLNRALGFMRAWVKPLAGTGPKEDNLDRFRRFEQQYPELGAEIESILQQPVEAAGKHLLELVVRVGGESLSDKHLSQVHVVRSRFGWI